MKYYINYADKTFKKNQEYAIIMAKKRGNFDKIIGYTNKNIDNEFYNKNNNILNQPRGGGFWLWKPYIIFKTLKIIENGDYLFYSDAGAFFRKSVDLLIEELNKHDQDIMGFELPLIESQWTKKELFINMKCDDIKYYNSNHMMGGYHLIKKSDLSMKFYKELLEYSCNEMNITDQYDLNIKKENDFIDHRHDQSIFSLLYKKYDLRPFKDPSQYGVYPFVYTASNIKNIDLKPGVIYKFRNGRKFRFYKYNEKYMNVIFNCRNKNPIISLNKFKVKILLNKIGYYNKI